jgi:spore coat polysaccharide biosynthesis predicted glycosyltransferase SpsG
VKRLLIRADASLSMGTGHVMRCLALAQAWQDAGGVVTLAAAASLPVLLRERLVREGIDVATVQAVAGSLGDADWVLALHAELDAGWLVLDGYHFDDRYQASVRRVAGGLLVVDDLGHLPYYSADVVLNQNITANDELYPACAVTTLRLCGGTYGLLRREFRLPSQGLRQAHGRACRVLVTMGGADADNVTGKVVRALQAMEDIEARVLVGAVNPYLDELREMSAQSSGRISILTAVEPWSISWIGHKRP